jgi:hypothetical protein
MYHPRLTGPDCTLNPVVVLLGLVITNWVLIIGCTPVGGCELSLFLEDGSFLGAFTFESYAFKSSVALATSFSLRLIFLSRLATFSGSTGVASWASVNFPRKVSRSFWCLSLIPSSLSCSISRIKLVGAHMPHTSRTYHELQDETLSRRVSKESCVFQSSGRRW